MTEPNELSPADIAENDQTAARAADLLDWYVDSARRTLGQGDRGEATAVIAHTLVAAEEAIPRDALASMLAIALVRLADQRGAS